MSKFKKRTFGNFKFVTENKTFDEAISILYRWVKNDDMHPNTFKSCVSYVYNDMPGSVESYEQFLENKNVTTRTN